MSALSLLKHLKQKGEAMKNIDIKSVIIGVLATVLIIVSMGATNQDENLGDIVVNSIKVVNENGKAGAILIATESGGNLWFYNYDEKVGAILTADESGGNLFLYNNDEKPAAILNTDESGGQLWIYNNDEKAGAGLTADESGGNLWIYNNDEKPAAILTADEFGGDLRIFNKHEKKVATLQANKNSDGAIGLYDRYGDFGWAESGKQ